MKILARICSQEEWKFCRVGLEYALLMKETDHASLQYDGEMSLHARDQSINDFRNDVSTKIMIASLKCGGVGLNLTMASKVVCVDLWWNSSVEQQGIYISLLSHYSPPTHPPAILIKSASILPRFPHRARIQNLHHQVHRPEHRRRKTPGDARQQV